MKFLSFCDIIIKEVNMEIEYKTINGKIQINNMNITELLLLNIIFNIGPDNIHNNKVSGNIFLIILTNKFTISNPF